MPKPTNPKGWTPSALTAPDGRAYTPGSWSEEQSLLLAGYRPAPAPAAAKVPAKAAQGEAK